METIEHEVHQVLNGVNQIEQLGIDEDAKVLLLLLLLLLLLVRCAATEDDNNVVASDGREYDPKHRDNGVHKYARSSNGR